MTKEFLMLTPCNPVSMLSQCIDAAKGPCFSGSSAFQAVRQPVLNCVAGISDACEHFQ